VKNITDRQSRECIPSIRNISVREAVTVAYTSAGFYRQDERCLCATCNPHCPPRVPSKGPFDPEAFLSKQGKKKSRRGGRRARMRWMNLGEVAEEKDDNEEVQDENGDEAQCWPGSIFVI
jgi:hypothetical protein